MKISRITKSLSVNSRLLLTAVSLFIAFSAWAFSSPATSSPDDDFHLGSIYCADGYSNDLCQSVGEVVVGSKTQVVIPAVGVPCFAGNPALPAKCQSETFANASQNAFANTGLYPSSFYKFLNTFISEQSGESILKMRLANSTIFVLLFILALYLGSRADRFLLSLMFALTSIPIAMFFIPSTNPSSWLYTSLLLNWAFQTSLLRNDLKSTHGVLAAIGMLLTGFMALESRADGKFFLAISIVTTYLLFVGVGKTRNKWVNVIPISLLGLSAFRLLSDDKFVGFGPSGGGSDWDSFSYLVTTITRAIEIPLGNLGLLASGGNLGILGWLDTPVLPIVSVITISLYFAWMFFLYSKRTALHHLVFWAHVFLLFSLPFYLLNTGKNLVGENVQPRYVLALLPLVLLCAVGLDRGETKFSSPIKGRLILTIVLLSIANLLSLMTNLARYTQGMSSLSLTDLNREIEWWWPNFVAPNTLLLLGGISFLFATIFMFSTSFKIDQQRDAK